MKSICLSLFLMIFLSGYSQNDSTIIRNIYTTALTKGEAHNDLRSLCKDVGARISGSAAAQMAVVWEKPK